MMHLNAHVEVYYDLTIKSVKQTKNNLVITGTLSIPIKNYSGSIHPMYRIFGVKNKPWIEVLMRQNIERKWYRNNKKMSYDFIFDMKAILLPNLSKKWKGASIKSYIQNPLKNTHTTFSNYAAGHLVPLLELSYNNTSSVFVYFTIPPLQSKNAPTQDVKIEER